MQTVQNVVTYQEMQDKLDAMVQLATEYGFHIGSGCYQYSRLMAKDFNYQDSHNRTQTIKTFLRLQLHGFSADSKISVGAWEETPDIKLGKAYNNYSQGESVEVILEGFKQWLDTHFN